MRRQGYRPAAAAFVLLSLTAIPAAVSSHASASSDGAPVVQADAGDHSALADQLALYGVSLELGSTNVYQANVRDGLDTHSKAGRFSGSYDIEIAADLQQSLGLQGLGLFIHAEGGWPDTEGINEAMVGSILGVNADAIGNRSLDIVEVILGWNMEDDRLNLAAGKMDAGGFFDTIAYANDEATQFLNGALVNNPTIPLPDYGLGAVLSVHLSDSWSIVGGLIDADADGRETGFRTAFHGEDHFFSALEAGFRSTLESTHGPLSGMYRLGLWYDPQPKAHSNSDREYRDDVGLYTSIDQMILRENEDPEDSQGLGVFARYGYADAKRNDINHFWSVGFQYQGLVQFRDTDVLGMGFAQDVFSDAAAETFTAARESVIELYYSMQFPPWIAISPSLQHICHPGGDQSIGSATVLGIRAHIRF